MDVLDEVAKTTIRKYRQRLKKQRKKHVTAASNAILRGDFGRAVEQTAYAYGVNSLDTILGEQERRMSKRPRKKA